MKTTDYLELVLPDFENTANIEDINSNMDKIDLFVKELNDRVVEMEESGAQQEEIEKIKDRINILEEAKVALDSKIDTHINNKENPHNITKQQVGLGKVNNTSDLDKPVSTAVKKELEGIKELIDLKIDEIPDVFHDLEQNAVKEEMTPSEFEYGVTLCSQSLITDFPTINEYGVSYTIIGKHSNYVQLFITRFGDIWSRKSSARSSWNGEWYNSKTEIEKKVDKVHGKGLSTNDFTNANKQALETDIPKRIDDLDNELDVVKQSVSDGKQKVSVAITDKGVETAPNATFDTMATNISNIVTDPSIGTTDAVAEDILSGKKVVSQGELITGAMPNHGSLSKTITTQGGTQKISPGYYSGGEVKAQFANLSPQNIIKGVNIGGVVGTYPSNVFYYPIASGVNNIFNVGTNKVRFRMYSVSSSVQFTVGKYDYPKRVDYDFVLHNGKISDVVKGPDEYVVVNNNSITVKTYFSGSSRIAVFDIL